MTEITHQEVLQRCQKAAEFYGYWDIEYVRYSGQGGQVCSCCNKHIDGRRSHYFVKTPDKNLANCSHPPVHCHYKFCENCYWSIYGYYQALAQKSGQPNPAIAQITETKMLKDELKAAVEKFKARVQYAR